LRSADIAPHNSLVCLTSFIFIKDWKWTSCRLVSASVSAEKYGREVSLHWNEQGKGLFPTPEFESSETDGKQKVDGRVLSRAHTMESPLRNLRISLRQLYLQASFSMAVILTLGLAIAANTAIFSFVNALLIRPFPFRDPEQLVQIRSVRGGQSGMMSTREVLDIKERVSVLESIAAHTSSAGGYNFSGEGRPQEWKAFLRPETFSRCLALRYSWEQSGRSYRTAKETTG
jgi:hypothetical protein